MGIRHSTVATAADEAGAEVNKAEWNDDHIIDDGSLSIAKTSGLQAALDGKQATIGDGDLTIARTDGLQAALDGKSEANRPESIIVAAGDETTAITVVTVALTAVNVKAYGI